MSNGCCRCPYCYGSGILLSGEVRRKVYERDGGICRHCQLQDHTSFTVDHIVSRQHGGSDELSNLQTLCWPCHEWKNMVEDYYPKWDRPLLTELDIKRYLLLGAPSRCGFYREGGV